MLRFVPSGDARKRPRSDRETHEDDHGGRHRGKGADHGPVEPHAGERAPRHDGDQADRRDRRRQADAEGDDERHPEADPVERDGAQQHDQGRRAREEPGGDPDPEDAARRQGVVVVVVMPMTVPVVVVVVIVVVRLAVVVVVVPGAGTRPHPLAEDTEADRDDEQPGGQGEPRDRAARGR